MGTAPVAFRQFFMDADGKSTAVTFRADGDAQAMTAASAGAILNPGASLKLTVSGSEQPYQESWSVISDDGVQNSLSGYAVIRRRTTPGNFHFEAATPLSTMQDFSVYMPFDNTQGFRTQLTLVNPASNLPGQVRLTYRSLTGETLLIDALVMKPGQQMSIVIPDAYPDLANKAGNVFVEANINRFSAVGIRYNERSGAIAPVPRLAFMTE
jgi:hypothetical protein